MNSRLFGLLGGDGRRSSLKVRSVDKVDKEHDLFKAQLDMLRSAILAHQQRRGTQQVALQQLVEQVQQLSQSLERLRFTFTQNGKRKYVPHDQVFRLIIVKCLLL